MKIFLLPLIAAAVLAVSGPAAAAGPDLAAAKDNYTTFCVKCHGAAGQGNGPAAATLHTKPRNYTDCATMSKISDDTLFKASDQGRRCCGRPQPGDAVVVQGVR